MGIARTPVADTLQSYSTMILPEESSDSVRKCSDVGFGGEAFARAVRDEKGDGIEME